MDMRPIELFRPAHVPAGRTVHAPSGTVAHAPRSSWNEVENDEA